MDLLLRGKVRKSMDGCSWRWLIGVPTGAANVSLPCNDGGHPGPACLCAFGLVAQLVRAHA